jgi:hypothetical protein
MERRDQQQRQQQQRQERAPFAIVQNWQKAVDMYLFKEHRLFDVKPSAPLKSLQPLYLG